MANNIEFRPEIDRVTEREMVYDIVERLKLGRDLPYKYNSNVYLGHAGDYLLDMFQRFSFMIPTSILDEIENIKTGVITIAAGTKGGSIAIPGASNIIRAYSEATGMDVQYSLTTAVTNGNLTASISTDVAYSKDDKIKIYAV